MPFGADWSSSVSQTTREVCGDGIEYVRGDTPIEPAIIERIWREIGRATHVLVDLTGNNPNVAFELGLARAIGRPVHLVAQGAVEAALFDGIEKLAVHVYSAADPESYRRAIAAFLFPRVTGPS